MFFLSISLLISAQAPTQISYQGVARNSSGTVISNQQIAIKFDIHQGSASGTIVFTEQHTGAAGVTTNAFGLFTTYIGSISNLGVINWANGPFFIEVSIDPANGTAYSSLGSQQLMSVPFALYAQTSGNSSSNPTITINSPNTISNPSFGIYSITVPSSSLSLNNNSLTISNGNTVVLPTATYSAGNGIDITGGVISNTLVPVTPTITGAGATSVSGTYPNLTIASPTVQTYSAGSGIDITSGVISNTATISLLGINAATVTGAYPNFTVNVPNSTMLPNAFNGQLLFHNGVIWDTIPRQKLYFDGNNVGIGTTSPQTNFHVVGGGRFDSHVSTPQVFTDNIKITGGNSGQVLTSDALGNGTWQTTNLNYNTSTNELALLQGTTTVATATLNGTGSNTVSITGAGMASVNPTTGSSFTVSVPNPTLSVNSGSISISNGNAVSLPVQTLSVGGGSIAISGGNAVAIPSSSTTLVQGSNVTLNQSGSTYTISAPAYSISLPGGNVAQITNGITTSTAPISPTNLTLSGSNNNILSAGGNTVGLNTYTVGNNLNISGGPNYTISAASYSLSANSNTLTLSNGAAVTTVTVPQQTLPLLTYSNTAAGGVLQSGPITNTVSIPNYTLSNTSNTITLNNGTVNSTAIVPVPVLTFTGSVLQSGPATNTVNLSSLSVWSNSVGVVYPTTLTNSVGVGTSGPLTDKMEINYASSPTSSHLHLRQGGADAFSRIKFSNSIATSKYWMSTVTSAVSDANSGYNFFYHNGSVGRNLFTVAGDGKVSVNPFGLVYPTLFEVNGAVELDSTIRFNGLNAMPPASNVSSGKLYFDKTSNKFKVSENGGAYVDLVPASSNGWSLLGNAGTNTTTNFIGTTDKIGLKFKTNNIDRLLIDTIGRVGIGNNTPFTAVHIKSEIGFPYVLLENALNQGGYIVARSGGTLGAPTYNGDGMSLGGFGVGGYDITNFGPSANMYGRTTEAWNSTSRGTALVFETTQNGTTNLSSKMIIDHNGYVGINTFNDYANPLSMLHVETDGSLDKGLRVSNTSSLTNGPSIYLDGQSQAWTITGANAGNGSGANKFVIRDYTNFTDRFVIDNTGNVGIGLVSPEGMLHVRNSAGSQIKFGNNNQPFYDWFFDVDGSANMYLKNESFGSSIMSFNPNNGFIGVGTNTAQAMLDVVSSSNVNAISASTSGTLEAFTAKNTNASTTSYAGNFDGGLTIKGKTTLNADYALKVSSSSFEVFGIRNNGNVGINVLNPSYKLQINSSNTVAALYSENIVTGNFANAHGIWGRVSSANTSTAAAAVFANSNGSGPSVYGFKNATDASGSAGRFEILNTANSADGVFVVTNGTGAAVHAVSGPTVAGSSNVALLLEGGHVKTVGGTPSVVTLIAGTASIVGNDIVGTYVITTTGSTTADQNIVNVTFNKPYSSAPNVMLFGNNGATFNAKPYATSVTSSGFTITFNGSVAPSTYSIKYLVIQ